MSQRRTSAPARARATLTEPPPEVSPSFYEAVYRVVQEVPAGRVATYGQIAAILGSPRAARAVGYALAALTHARAEVVPWQRIINREGLISSRGDIVRAEIQRQRLQQEGIRFEPDGHIDLSLYLWEGFVFPSHR